MPFPPTMPITVSAAVRRGDEFLFVHDTHSEFAGLWTFPTGFVDQGEMPDAAAIRETSEETSVECALEGLISVTTIMWRGAPMLYLVYLAHYISGDPTPDGKEADAAAFLGLDALTSLPVEGLNAFLARRILSGEARVLFPHTDVAWHAMYRTTWT
ncbi:MAG: NUDIX hydrolase [Anaerolineae bacterium]|nr:NUDIX hydrolase [Anaerolineae bacterium]